MSSASSTPEPDPPGDARGPAGPTERIEADDPLEALRRELEGLDNLPVAERVARFREANDVLAAELAQLDEV